MTGDARAHFVEIVARDKTGPSTLQPDGWTYKDFRLAAGTLPQNLISL
jgi:hypothetical protein